MTDAKGIIFAYNVSPDLGELVKKRTASSIPFAGRYRLIDFALSSMMNAGIFDVGVIMQRDYQSLLDHLGSGKVWDMDRKTGGLRLLPPFGLPEYHRGNYSGTIEAMNAVFTYLEEIRQNNVVLMLGSLCANIDLTEALAQHTASDADITAICSDRELPSQHYKYVADRDGVVKEAKFSGSAEGLTSLECYIVKTPVLLDIVRKAAEKNQYQFHKEAIRDFLLDGGKMQVYVHRGYVSFVRTIGEYFQANMDLMVPANRWSLFPKERPVKTKNNEGVSTFYGEDARVSNCLLADSCRIEGTVENCVICPGVRIEKGAKVKDCILMRGCTVGKNTQLRYVIADKFAQFSDEEVLAGSSRLPIVVPKESKI
ncbi:MAG: glucose-1-phosphate adenylyltransferase subunit GlgD [Oscillospiraceae bacterium]|nr:glucose-1-phosphate adenylyltransferase subunit GlgD [Oscillospiraceae bacterium]